MKKISYIAIAALAAFSMTGCKDFLDVQPEGTPTETTYFQNDDQAINAIKALYAPAYDGDDLFGRELYWEQHASSQLVCGRTTGWASTLYTLTVSGDESPLNNCWSCCYRFAQRANWVVNRMLKKEKEQTLTEIENRSLGEAYFMRAVFHFTIAYRYGTKDQGVPFIKYEEYNDGDYDWSIPPQQETVMKNYEMIIDDLEKAKARLPRYEEYGSADIGRTHQAACVGFESKVYAYWATWDSSKWDNVIACVDELENTYGRKLQASYSDLFDVDWDWVKGKESGWWGTEYVWSFPSNGGADWTIAGPEMPGVVLENKGWGIYNGWGEFKPSLDCYNEFLKDGAGNERLTRSILEYGQEFMFNGEQRRFYSTSDVESGFQINKWMAPFAYEDFVNAGYVSHNGGGMPCARVNWTFIRFAECMLFRAEAYLAKGNASKAAEDINAIRARVNLPSVGNTATWTDLWHERYCELAFEFVSDHLADCKRWAVSGNAEIKALAIADIEKHPDVRHYEDRSDPDSDFTVGPYLDYQSPKKVWADYKIAFPYSSNELTKSAGKLKQNAGY